MKIKIRYFKDGKWLSATYKDEEMAQIAWDVYGKSYPAQWMEKGKIIKENKK